MTVLEMIENTAYSVMFILVVVVIHGLFKRSSE